MKYKNLYTIRGDAVKSNLEDLKKIDDYYMQLVKNSPFVSTKIKIILDTIGPKYQISDPCEKYKCPTKCPPCGSKNLINSIEDLKKYLKTQKGITVFSSKYKLKQPRLPARHTPDGPFERPNDGSSNILEIKEEEPEVRYYNATPFSFEPTYVPMYPRTTTSTER